jgi:hypothetical protein
MRKAYSTHKLLGYRFKNVPFSVFYTMLQSPYFASQFWGQTDFLESLPDDLKVRVITARRHIGYGMASIVLWIIFVFSFGALAAYLRRHTLGHEVFELGRR